jgi:hypothetical protein
LYFYWAGTNFIDRALHIPHLGRLLLIVGSRYARNYIPKFQAKFYVAKEEPDSPFQGFVQRYRQGFGHHVVGLQDPGADRAHPEGTRAITKRDRFSGVTYDAAWYAD